MDFCENSAVHGFVEIKRCLQRALRLEKSVERGRELAIENADIGIMCSGMCAADNWVNEGKTQLALKYVKDHQDDYNPILWIDSKVEDSVRSSFERWASELQLSVDRTQTQGSSPLDSPTVQAVLRWFCNRKDTDEAWLAIFDNADDVTWGIKKVLPKGQRGSVIITSQDSQSQKLVDGGCVNVGVCTEFKPVEAKVPLPFSGTVGFPPHMEGHYKLSLTIWTTFFIEHRAFFNVLTRHSNTSASNEYHMQGVSRLGR